MNIYKAFVSLLLASAFGTSAIAASLDPGLFAGMQARNIGPAGVSGRISAVASVASDPNIILAGAASGGVWRSDNAGVTWTPLFDDQAVHSIGAIAINQVYPDIIWVGTGEGAVRNTVSIGDGMYRSTDGGKTWVKLGLEGTERINRIALHPTNPDVAYVSALGPLWQDGGERGVYKTVDGGKTWSQVLSGPNARTGATDIKVDPHNPNKLFASLWEFRRWPYRFESGGPGSGLYRSVDAGETWIPLSGADGMPTGELGRSVFAISPSDSDRVYALVEAERSVLVRSDDGGVSWSTVNDDVDVAVRPYYYMLLEVDPTDPDTVYNIESRVRRSVDGGSTFGYIEAIKCCAPSQTIHIDTHAWWINPADPRHIISGNDGGIAITRDGGNTWRFVENLPLAQLYHVAVDNSHPYHVYGGLQDNGSWKGPAETFDIGGLRNLHWMEVGFGDGFDTVPDPEIPGTGYTMSQGGELSRWNVNTGERRLIRPPPPSADSDLRFNWSAGFALDPFDAGTIYFGSQFLHKSTDRGLTWSVISKDLSTNKEEWQTYRTSGGITPDVTTAENFTTIVAVAPSKIERGVIWVGTDDGRIHVTRDGGASWNSVEDRVRGVPPNTWVSMIYPSPHAADTAYVVFDNHRRGDFRPYIYRSENYGNKWASLEDDLIKGYALSILQDPVDPKLLWLGTEFGLYLSLSGGNYWTPFTAGIPTASVMDLAFQGRENDLVLGTHGRGVFILDDVSPLRGLENGDFSQRLSIIGVTDGQQYDYRPVKGGRWWGDAEHVSPNEPYGVVLTFIASGDDLPHPDAELEELRQASLSNGDQDAPAPQVTVHVSDEMGEKVRTFRADVKQGINRVVWDMRRDALPPLPGEDQKIGGQQGEGIQVLPGTYRFRLVLGAEEESVEAKVKPDPAVENSEAAMQASQAAQLRLQALQATINDALTWIAGTRRDLRTIQALLADADRPAAHDGFSMLIESNLEKLYALEWLFRQPVSAKGVPFIGNTASSLLNRAKSFLASSYPSSYDSHTTHDGPSPAARNFMELAESRVRDAVSKLNAYRDGDFVALRTAFAQSELSLLSQEPLTLGPET